MNYDAIIFDFDGVLLTGRGTPPGVYENATRELLRGFGNRNQEHWSASLQKPDNADEFREAARSLNLSPQHAWGYREATATRIERIWIESGQRRPFADTDELSTLGAKYPIGVASNNRHGVVEFCVNEFDWSESIDVIRGRFPTLADFDRLKPDPYFLNSVIDGLEATSPLFVGDRATDILAAERAGCDSALIRRPEQPKPADASPTYEISSLADLDGVMSSKRTER